MGDLVQQGITQQDYSVTAAVLAVSTFALLTVLLGWVNWRWGRVRPFISGVPLVIVKDGRPVVEALRTERMPLEELWAQARLQGIEQLGDIDLAVLETDGKVSFFTRSNEGEGAPDTQPSAV
jgi:uncharacterized membrane protein YcaP (DUF421 family)